MGSPMRSRGTVESFKTGMNEGVRGLGFGLWDGITGLVTEPMDGARKDGAGGFVSGMAKSCE
jgi:hypothetical protein